MRVERMFLLTIPVLLLAACGPASAPTLAFTASPAEAPKTRVVVLLPGPTADGSWNMLGYEGVRQLEQETKAHEVDGGIFQGGTTWAPPFDQTFKAGRGEFSPGVVSDEEAASVKEIQQEILKGVIVVRIDDR